MTEIVQFIQAHHIDSFQKLRVLLFFFQHPESNWSGQQLAEQLYLGDGPLLDEIIAQLHAAGLVNCAAHRCKLNDEVEIKLSLQQLINKYKNPLARQEILDRVRHIVINNTGG